MARRRSPEGGAMAAATTNKSTGLTAAPSVLHTAHDTVGQRAAIGREARAKVPRSSHREWVLAANRPDPVTLLVQQNERRLPWLVPLRHARMSVAPFAFIRGASRVMTTDIASTPVTGLVVQIGDDAHLSNFAAYV